MQRRRRGQVEHADIHAGNRRLMLDSALMTDGDTEKLRSKLRAVRDAKRAGANLEGAISGRALYDGRIDLKQALELSNA